MGFSDYLSSVYLFMSINFTNFRLLHTNLAQSIVWLGKFMFVQIKGSRPFPKGHNDEIVKIRWGSLKIFSRSTGSTNIQTWHKTSLCKEESSLFKWRASLFPMVDVPISTKLGPEHLWVKVTQCFGKKGSFQFSKRIMIFFRNQCYGYIFAQMCLLTVTVSQVSDVDHGPLYF